MRIPACIALRMLRRDPRGDAVRPAKDDGAAHLATRHVAGFRCRIDDLVDRLHRKVEGHELDDRPQTGKAGADTKAGKLSGGEKARLLLGLATFFGPNMIILDEPTNHLDIDSRAALAEAINDFPGAVIMVSHDRYLIEACADQLWHGQDV